MLTADILTAEDILLIRLKYPDDYNLYPPGFEIEYSFIEFYDEYLERNNTEHTTEELWWYFHNMFDEEWQDENDVDGHF